MHRCIFLDVRTSFELSYIIKKDVVEKSVFYSNRSSDKIKHICRSIITYTLSFRFIWVGQGGCSKTNLQIEQLHCPGDDSSCQQTNVAFLWIALGKRMR